MTFPGRSVACLVLSLVLGACSSDGTNERAVATLVDYARAAVTPAEPIRIPAGRPYIVLSYGGGKTPMSLLSETDGIAQYEGPGGLEMTLNNGLLTRLRRLGQEFEALYTFERGAYRGNLLDQSRSNEATTRIMVYWIDQKPYRDRMRCRFAFDRISAGLRRFSEACMSLYSGLEMENTYWTDRNGTLVRSIQWFHPKALSVEIDHLHRKVAVSDR